MIKISTQGNSGLTLVKIGAMVLFAQNIIWFIGGFIAVGALYDIILYIDLIGFLHMGIGYIMTANDCGSQNYLYGGLRFIGWVVVVCYGNLF